MLLFLHIMASHPALTVVHLDIVSYMFHVQTYAYDSCLHICDTKYKRIFASYICQSVNSVMDCSIRYNDCTIGVYLPFDQLSSILFWFCVANLLDIILFK